MTGRLLRHVICSCRLKGSINQSREIEVAEFSSLANEPYLTFSTSIAGGDIAR